LRELVAPVLRVKKFQAKARNSGFCHYCFGLLHGLSWFVTIVLGQHFGPKRKSFFLDILTFEDGTDTLFQTVGNKKSMHHSRSE
jgi:hypothetical protein